MFGKDLEAHGHDVHEGDARAEPQELPHEGIDDEEKLICLVNKLVELVFGIILYQFGDLFLLFLGRHVAHWHASSKCCRVHIVCGN